MPGKDRYIVPVPSDRDVSGLIAKCKAHLYFTDEEEVRGSAELLKMGIPKEGEFICFHNRDEVYLDTVLDGADWSYHDFRDSKIADYLPAARALADQGYYLLRMGSHVKEQLNAAHPRVIDYATRFRSDFMDIYINAKCRFFIASNAGIFAIATVFRRPVAFVNFIPLEYVRASNPHDLFIPKKLWLKDERRFLRFREIIESGIGRLFDTEKYAKLGIEVIDNTPQEICALTSEMDERLKGSWKALAEDDALQQCFWSIFKNSELNRVFLLRIGAEFLRQNRSLLDEGAG